MSTIDLSALRENYTHAGLDERETATDPVEQFARWFTDAQAAGVREPNAMTLATATPDGVPSARIVLLKGFGPDGFVLYTNYGSQKGRELDANPRAALIVYWDALERQVRITGRVERVSAEETKRYFHSRPRGSQLGAWASAQSTVIPDRTTVEDRLRDMTAKFTDEIPVPPFWGGYRVLPQSIEFWQGRPNRLHDRLRYTLDADGSWQRDRLSP